MKHAIAMTLCLTVGCGAILNAGSRTAILPPGASINGQEGSVELRQDQAYLVQMPGGGTCAIQSNISPGWAIADVFFTLLIGVVVDAATGGWKSLDASGCPGVALN